MRKHFLTVCLGIESTAPPGIRMSSRGATPARVGLGVTTVLTMTTLMASTNAALPKISYVKSIDVYLGFCFFMVFASLLGNLTNKTKIYSSKNKIHSFRHYI